MVKIAAAVIAGSNVRREQWSRMVGSLKPHVDLIALSWNGGMKKPPAWMRDCGIPLAWSRVPWTGDFSVQRNASFAIASATDSDWILWIDTDDQLVCSTTLRDTVGSLDPYTSALMLRYDYAVDADGTVQIVQWRERLLRTGVPWAWDYYVHEICEAPHGTQFARREDTWMRHYHEERDDEAVRVRNRPLVEAMLTDRPEVEVFHFYMGQELLAEAQLTKDEDRRPELMEAAAKEYLHYIQAEPWADNAYIANHHVADIYRELGKLGEAMERDMQGLKLRPTWPDSYNGLALTALMMGEPAHARDWASISMQVGETPYTSQAAEPMELTYTPHMLRSVAFERLGDIPAAIDDLKESMKYWKPEQNVKRLEELEAKEIPDDLNDLRKSRRGRKSQPSIAFFTKTLFEPWHPAIEAKGGIGGAETCIIRLAPQFAAAGWRVAVYGTPGEHEGIDEDGVEWWKTIDFVASEPFDVLVSSRAPEIFDNVPNVDHTVLWCHDVHLGDEWKETKHGDRRARVDTVVALSQWHARHLRRLYGDSFREVAVVPNGLDVERFSAPPSLREGPHFAYSSSPDRGLDTLLEMWPEIRRRFEGATLDIFYGWSSIDSIIKVNPDSFIARRLSMFKARVEALIEACGGEQGGIFWRGRLPQDQLAEHLYGMNAWLHPTTFLETHCITAYEMQAAGVIPVTSDIGALKEAVPVDWLRVSGWPDNKDYRERWMATLERVMSLKPGERQMLVADNRAHALSYSWEDAFKLWMRTLAMPEVRRLASVL